MKYNKNLELLWRMPSGAQSLAARECELPPAVEKNESPKPQKNEIILNIIE